jgi:hypothetical protein
MLAIVPEAAPSLAEVVADLAPRAGEDTLRQASATSRSHEKDVLGRSLDCSSLVVGLAGVSEEVAEKSLAARSVRDVPARRLEIEKTRLFLLTLGRRQSCRRALEACMLAVLELAGEAADRLEAPQFSGVYQTRR